MINVSSTNSDYALVDILREAKRAGVHRKEAATLLWKSRWTLKQGPVRYGYHALLEQMNRRALGEVYGND